MLQWLHSWQTTKEEQHGFNTNWMGGVYSLPKHRPLSNTAYFSWATMIQHTKDRKPGFRAQQTEIVYLIHQIIMQAGCSFYFYALTVSDVSYTDLIAFRVSTYSEIFANHYESIFRTSGQLN